MPKTILLNLSEADALTVHRMCQLCPGMGWVYDSRPLLQFILQDVFNGRQDFHKVTAMDILESGGLTLEQAGGLYHEISNTVLDIVTGYMPHLDGATHGYTYKIGANFDLEITIPEFSLVSPQETRQAIFQMDVVEEIKEALADGDFVPEALRRFAGC